MQYVDKGSVVPPPFNLLPSGKYFIEICKRCYDRMMSQRVRKSLLFCRFSCRLIKNLTCPRVLRVDSVIRNYAMLYIFVVKV